MGRSNAKIPTTSDFKCYNALKHVLKPEHHHLIDSWMLTASDKEKQGVLLLAGMSEPTLLRTVGCPQAAGHAMTMTSSPWLAAKRTRLGPDHPAGFPIRENDQMQRSYSMPNFMQEEPGMNAWQAEDHHEVSQIPKPGGYAIKMKDSVEIMRLKNAQRNKGTYKLFGGTFDGTTTQNRTHNLTAVGLER